MYQCFSGNQDLFPLLYQHVHTLTPPIAFSQKKSNSSHIEGKNRKVDLTRQVMLTLSH